MTLEEAIQHLRESLADHTHKWGCDECKQEHEKLLEWLEDYKELRAVNTENEELKRMLRLAIDELEPLGSCGGSSYRPCEGCPYNTNDGRCSSKWNHHDEAMELLGGTENAEN